MTMFTTVHKVEREVAGRTLSLETGKIGRQCAGAVTVRWGDNVVFVAVTDDKPREGIDFFPLTCDYREKTSSVGKIPGGFFKREGRPTTKETLTSRLIDRPIRPQFPDGFIRDIAVNAMVLSADPEFDPDIPAMIGASAALTISRIPFDGPLGAVRMGMKNGKLVAMPSYFDLEVGQLDLIVAAKKDAIAMVECGADEITEEVMIEALLEAQKICAEICEMQNELAAKVGNEKMTVEPPKKPTELIEKLRKGYAARLVEANYVEGKLARKDALGAIYDEIKEKHTSGIEDRFEKKDAEKELASAYGSLLKELVRGEVLKGTRSDKRGYEDIRAIECEVGVLPRCHGSALFTRGETQAIITVTLGTQYDEQRLDGLREGRFNRFMLHYNFPSYCVGETWPNRGPKRREIGHGALAERAVRAVLPDYEQFPYTIRIVSDITESNGSSSMATVCGGTLALMDAGVPIKRPVAGIAMGLIKEGDKVCVLTDILGLEDHLGDMDFKVAGTQKGITALQMDIKLAGLDRKVMEQALEQARKARLDVLRSMLKSLPRPRSDVGVHAPRIVHVPISGDKIGNLIGPGGRTIRRLQEETNTSIDINDAKGFVTVAAYGPSNLEEAVRIVRALTEEIEVGRVYRGRVISVKDFGAFIEILPGQEGMLHVSEMSNEFVSDVNEFCAVGDTLEVAVVGIDPQGRIRLSRKPLLEPSREPATVGAGDDFDDDEDDFDDEE